MTIKFFKILSRNTGGSLILLGSDFVVWLVFFLGGEGVCSSICNVSGRSEFVKILPSTKTRRFNTHEN